jgi:hypothetical protein
VAGADLSTRAFHLDRLRISRMEYGVRPPGLNRRVRPGQGWRLRVVSVAAGCRPAGTTIGKVGDGPAGGLLDLVVAPALGTQVGLAGGARATGWIMGSTVIDVTAVRRHPTTRKLAGRIPGMHEPSKVCRRSVAHCAVVDGPSGYRVGQNPPPRASGGAPAPRQPGSGRTQPVPLGGRRHPAASCRER